MSKYPYTYVVLRYVHDTGTGEFANVGVVLSSPEAHFADAILRPTYGRLSKMFPNLNGEHFRTVIRHLQQRFAELAAAVHDEMDLGLHPKDARELALAVIVPDDSSFQWSSMGSGLSADLPATLESIYQRMVMRYDEKPRTGSRSDDEIWKTFKLGLERRHVLSRLTPKTIAARDDEVEFSHAWQNRKWHCMEALSFDLMQPQSIKEKAYGWLGKINSVHDATEDFDVFFLVGEPQLARSKRAFDNALNILHKSPVEHEIVREHEAESFAATVAADIAEHDREANHGVPDAG